MMKSVNIKVVHSCSHCLVIILYYFHVSDFQAMSLYWAVSAFFGLTQNIAFKVPSVRRRLGIPKTPSESEHPFQDLKNLAQLKGEEFLRIQREGRPVKKKK